MVAADLVVVAADDRFLRRDVGMGEQSQQRCRVSCTAGTASLATRVRAAPPSSSRCGRPSCRNFVSSSSTTCVAVTDAQHAVAGERAEHRQLRRRGGTAGRTAIVQRCGRDGDDHALLRLAEPDLPRRAAPGTSAGRSARSTSAPTPSAISPIADDRPPAPQSVIAVYRSVRVGEQVDQQLLGDRVADLHAGAGDVARGRVHRGARERRAAQPVTTGAAAQHDDQIAGVRTGQWGTSSAATPMHPQKTSGLAV